MRHSAVFFLCLALLMGCQASGIRGFWNDVPLMEEDLSVSEDRFASFAEQAVSAPEEEALVAMDDLFDKLKEDPVAYYIYTEWIDGSFYSPQHVGKIDRDYAFSYAKRCDKKTLIEGCHHMFFADSFVAPIYVKPPFGLICILFKFFTFQTMNGNTFTGVNNSDYSVARQRVTTFTE